MPTEDAYSSGHLVYPTLGLACVLMLRPISPELVFFPVFEFRTSLSTSILLLIESNYESPYTYRKIKNQSETTKTPPKTPITQRLLTILGRSVWVSTASQLVWLNRWTGSQSFHSEQHLWNRRYDHAGITLHSAESWIRVITKENNIYTCMFRCNNCVSRQGENSLHYCLS